MKTPIYVLAGTIALLALALLFGTGDTRLSLGSVSRASEYHAAFFSASVNNQVYKSQATLLEGAGTLGSIVITGQQDGTIMAYDATTTDVTKRATALSTTSLSVIAYIPTKMATGTYTFDAAFVNGLLLDFQGNKPTTTITWRE